MEQEAPHGELVLKLIVSFLEWKELLRTVDLVCKHWRRITASDEVWKRYCDAKMELRRIWILNSAPDDPKNEIIPKQLESQPRKPYRDIFILNERMRRHYLHHNSHGPDANRVPQEDSRSLRIASLNDLRWIVLPTIEVLRNLFGEPHRCRTNRFSLEAQQKRELKNQLLDFARKDPKRESMLQRESPASMEKEDLATRAGEYLLAAATLKSRNPSDRLIDDPSTLSVTFGEMIDSLGRIAGNELTLNVTLLVKHTSQGFEREYSFEPLLNKKLKAALCQMEWPLSPSDTVHFLIKNLWPDRLDLDRPFENQAWNIDEAWDEAVKQWWLSLTESLRETLVDIYHNRYGALPEFEDTTEIPLENLHQIASVPLIRGDLERKIWKEADADVKETLLDFFLKISGLFLDAIRNEYSNVYGERSSEMNAKLLLEVFLEVSHPSVANFPDMTREYCELLPDRLEGAFNRWNELVEAARRDEAVLWNPQTWAELDSLESKFSVGSVRQRNTFDGEFVVNSLVTKFLYSVLSPEHVPEYSVMRGGVEKLVKDIDSMMGKSGDLKVPQHEWENLINEWQGDGGLLKDFTRYRDHIHLREHAMLALIPLMQHLSSVDSKKLIYAVFIQHEHGGFSKNHFGTYTFDHHNLPCGQGQDFITDFGEAIGWIKFPRFKYGGHETLLRLFGLPLPTNIVAAMADFLVERLYQHDHPSDVDFCKCINALRVLPYLKRSVNENPEGASLVWECLERALKNAIRAVENWDEEDIVENERLVFTRVIMSLVGACIATHALQVEPTIRNVYEGTQFAILTQDIIPLDTVLQRLHETPLIFLNSQEFYDNIDEW
jgi:hypothetical protein